MALSKKTAKKVPANLPQPPTPQVVKQKELTKRKAKVDGKITKPRILSQSATSRRFQPISESESENDSENVPLSISQQGGSRLTYLPESGGE